MDSVWHAEKYQTLLIVGAFEKILATMKSRKVQGDFRVDFLQQILIEIPCLSKEEESLIDDVKSSKNLDEQVSRIAKLCERLVKDTQLARAHKDTVEGMSCFLQKLGTSKRLGREAQKNAAHAVRLASELFMSPLEKAVDMAYHFFKKIIFRNFS